MVVIEVGTTWSHPSLLTHASDWARPGWPSAVGTLERRSPAFAELGFFWLLLPSVNSNHVHAAYTASTIVDSLVAAFRLGATPKSQHLGFQSTSDLMSGVQICRGVTSFIVIRAAEAVSCLGATQLSRRRRYPSLPNSMALAPRRNLLLFVLSLSESLDHSWSASGLSSDE